MRPQKILDQDLLIALSKVFRSKGYEGASLKELAEATGLQKASLYHRFPKGKQEMAESVLKHMAKWVEENILAALNNENDSLELRLKNGLAHVRTLYDGGKETCIFRAFSMETGLDLFEESINEGLNEWIDTFTQLGISANLTAEIAHKNAIQTLIEIQGSLILTKALNDTNVFNNTLINIEKRYLNS